MSKTVAEMGFEEAMAALEERVRKIESGELPLEETLALYEEGVQPRATMPRPTGRSRPARCRIDTWLIWG